MSVLKFRFPAILVFSGCALTLLVFWVARLSTARDLELLLARIAEAPQATEFVFEDSDGRVFDRQVSPVNYKPLELAEIDNDLTADLLQLEDRSFYAHSGVDILRTLRVVAERILLTRYIFGTRVTGGSTITQQLIKNMLGHSERTPWQKWKELVLALRLEQSLAGQPGQDHQAAKKLILKNYWDYLFITHRLRGIGQLPQAVFGARSLKCRLDALHGGGKICDLVSLKSLTREQRLFILGLVKSPALVTGRREEAQAFFLRIHAQLSARGRMDSRLPGPSVEILMSYRGKLMDFREKSSRSSGQAELTTSYARSLSNLFAAELKGENLALKKNLVHTGRISPLDTVMHEVLARKLEFLNTLLKERCGITGAYMLMRLSDAAVIAASEDRCSEFNELVQARRQVSSTIKPLLYAHAMERLGLEPNAIFTDKRITVTGKDGKPYSPANHYKSFRGAMNLKNALQVSANTVSLQLFQKIDAEDFRKKIAVAFERVPGEAVLAGLHSDYSLALGTVDMAPSHVLAAYATLLNRGVKRYPSWGFISASGPHMSAPKIPLPAPPTGARLFSELRSEQVREMLTAVLRPEGTGAEYLAPQADFLIHELGAKSGSGTLDTWFVGYSEDLLLMVWLGFRRNVHKARDFHAATLWYDLFLKTLPYFPARPMQYMPGTEIRYFCANTGAPVTDDCRKISSALFRRE